MPPRPPPHVPPSASQAPPSGGPPPGWNPEVSYTPGVRGAEKYGKKPNAAERAKRVAIVGELLVYGYSNRDIGRYCSASTDWDVTFRTVEDYIAEANAGLAEEQRRLAGAAEYREAQLRLSVARFTQTYQKATAAGDHGAAVRAQRELAKILSQYPPPPPKPGADVPPEPAPAAPSAPSGPGTMAGRADVLRDLLSAAAARAAADGVPLTPPHPDHA